MKLLFIINALYAIKFKFITFNNEGYFNETTPVDEFLYEITKYVINSD